MAADGGDMVWLCRGNRGGSIVRQRGNKSHGCSSDAEVLGLWHEVARLNCHCWMVLGKNHTHALKTPFLSLRLRTGNAGLTSFALDQWQCAIS